MRPWLGLLLPLIIIVRAPGEVVAVAVGVEAYDDAEVSPLRFAANDAAAFAGQINAGGVPRRNVRLLTTAQPEPARQPTRETLLQALEWLRASCTQDDTAILFFAGHGVEVEGQPILMLSNTRRRLLAETGLSLDAVGKALAGTRAKRIVLLIDACRNDPDQGRGDADAKLSEGFTRGLRPRLTGSAGAPAIAMLLACDVGQRAWEVPAARHGSFTLALLRGLNGGAGQPGEAVMMTALAAFVEREVNDWARSEGRQQSPRLINPDGLEATLTTVPSEPVVHLSARDVPLAEVVTGLEAESGQRVVLDEHTNPDLRVTAEAWGRPLDSALRLLAIGLGLKVTKEQGVWMVSGARPPASSKRTVIISAAGDGNYYSLKGALRREPPGTRFLVRPGIYEGQVVVDRPAEILGDGPRDSIVFTSERAPCIRLRGDGILLRGIRCQADYARGQAAPFGALEVVGGRPVVEDCAVRLVFDGGVDGQACVLVSGGDAEPTFRRVIVHDSTAAGFLVQPSGGMLLEDCSAVRAGNGVCSFSPGPVRAEGCDFGQVGRGAFAGPSAKVVLADSFIHDVTNGRGLSTSAGGELVVDNCEFTDCVWTVEVAGRLTCRRSRFSMCGIGTVIGTARYEGCRWSDIDAACVRAEYGGSAEVTDCVFESVRNGVSTFGPGARATVTDCQFSGGQTVGVVCAAESTMIVTGCLFRGIRAAFLGPTGLPATPDMLTEHDNTIE